MENHAIVTKGFHILRDMLAPYIGRELRLFDFTGMLFLERNCLSTTAPGRKN